MVLLDLGSDFVAPSWTPLALVGLLLIVLALLFVSLRGHLRKIDVPGEADVEQPAEGEPRG